MALFPNIHNNIVFLEQSRMSGTVTLLFKTIQFATHATNHALLLWLLFQMELSNFVVILSDMHQPTKHR